MKHRSGTPTPSFEHTPRKNWKPTNQLSNHYQNNIENYHNVYQKRRRQAEGTKKEEETTYEGKSLARHNFGYQPTKQRASCTYVRKYASWFLDIRSSIRRITAFREQATAQLCVITARTCARQRTNYSRPLIIVRLWNGRCAQRVDNTRSCPLFPARSNREQRHGERGWQSTRVT